MQEVSIGACGQRGGCGGSGSGRGVGAGVGGPGAEVGFAVGAEPGGLQSLGHEGGHQRGPAAQQAGVRREEGVGGYTLLLLLLLLLNCQGKLSRQQHGVESHISKGAPYK